MAMQTLDGLEYMYLQGLDTKSSVSTFFAKSRVGRYSVGNN